MTASQPLVSVVVPVYNGARSITELVDRLAALANNVGIHEIILVDDASSDESWAVIGTLAAANSRIRGVALAQNSGQHAALLAGIAKSNGDVIITMDDDLQHRPEDIPVLLEALRPDVDLVYGQSVVEEHGLFRNVTSRASKAAIAFAAGSDAARLASGFRCFRSTHRAVLIEERGSYVSLDVLLSWVCRSVIAVPVTMEERRYGASNYTPSRLVRHAVNMLFGYSTAPLRLVSYVGFAVALFGIALLVFVVLRSVIGDSGVPGFAFIASMIALFSGFQIAVLGIFGEYMARLYTKALRRPAYIVRATIDNED